MAGLKCPKCQGEMRAYERSGVTVDQCEECRGIFLDRGELERLMDMESRYAASPPPPPAAPPPGYPPPEGYQQRPSVWTEIFGGGHHGGYRRGHH